MAKAKQGWFLPLMALVFVLFVFSKSQKNTTESPSTAPEVSALSSPASAATLAPKGENPEEIVEVDTLNVRDQAQGKVISKIKRGTKVRIYERSSDSSWARISAENLPPQWVSASALCEESRCRSAGNPVSAPLPPTEPKRTPPIREYSCSCSGGNVCIGPRGGRYCITSGGNKRYGV
jgi:hypothetical protein